ncbi:MAG: lysophospholipase [Cyclobacteriaceae bacterium]|jgi:uncharacterized protein|nr:lysophospholipase [Cyclobacteriaceae bacterium]
MRFLKVSFYVFSAYISLVFIFYFLQEKFIFQASSLPDHHQFDIDKEFEEVYLNTAEKARIHGVLIKSDSTKGVILYFHGNRKNIARWGNLACYFSDCNYDVLVMDYRGYGKSRGQRSEQLLHSDAKWLMIICKKNTAQIKL